MGPPEDDNDRMVAAGALVAASGAHDMQVAYLREDVPSEDAGWYAQAFYQGARIIAEGYRSEVDAAEGLALKILGFSLCAFCGQFISTGDDPNFLFAPPRSICRWRRVSQRWTPGCE